MIPIGFVFTDKSSSLHTQVRHGNEFANDTFLGKQLPLLAAYGACLIVRSCAKEAYKKKGRAMMTSDMIEEIGRAFSQEFETPETSGNSGVKL